jgi:hypothetical protein
MDSSTQSSTEAYASLDIAGAMEGEHNLSRRISILPVFFIDRTGNIFLQLCHIDLLHGVIRGCVCHKTHGMPRWYHVSMVYRWHTNKYEQHELQAWPQQVLFANISYVEE